MKCNNKAHWKYFQNVDGGGGQKRYDNRVLKNWKHF